MWSSSEQGADISASKQVVQFLIRLMYFIFLTGIVLHTIVCLFVCLFV